MKKILLGVLFTTFAMNSQVTVEPGVRAGLNLSSISNSDSDYLADFYAGGFVSINFKTFYTLQPELNYTRQGGSINTYIQSYDPVIGPGQTRKEDLEVQYLSLGIINKFRIVKGFHAMIGPSIDLKIGDNMENGVLAGADVAMQGGVGYKFENGFGIEFRYKNGLSDIFGNDYYDYDYGYEYNNYYNDIKLNQVIQIGGSYTF